jgi:hypothetical protein
MSDRARLVDCPRSDCHAEDRLAALDTLLVYSLWMSLDFPDLLQQQHFLVDSLFLHRSSMIHVCSLGKAEASLAEKVDQYCC